MSDTSDYPYSLLCEVNASSLQIIEEILRMYTLTRGCVDTLGDSLLEKIEYCFFKSGSKIISQGDSGKDIFLVCTGSLDVLVDEKVILELPSPTIVGDKAIVDLDSKRAATIQISEKEESLVIKIPMNSFIRSFKDSTLEDSEFNQEVNIFKNVFQAIQSRLFEFMYVQQNLWESTNASVKALNVEKIVEYIDQKIEIEWRTEIWDMIKNYLKAKLNVEWKEGTPANIENLHNFLKNTLDQKYGNIAVKELISARDREWSVYLNMIGKRVIQSLADDEKLFVPPELELFNPYIYRMRLIRLLKQLEKKYDQYSSKEKSDVKRNSLVYFGKGERLNEFNLAKYLSDFHKLFQLPVPRKTEAQIAQRCALIAAECENKFNASIIKMQEFIENVSAKTKIEQIEDHFSVDPQKIAQGISKLLEGITNYQKYHSNFYSGKLGEIQFRTDTYPTIQELIRVYKVDNVKKQMQQYYLFLMKSIKFQGEYLSRQHLMKFFYLLSLERGDKIYEQELNERYWFTISDEPMMCYEKDRTLETLLQLKTGMMLGGSDWKRRESNEEEGILSKNNFSVQTQQTTIMLVLPIEVLPWNQSSNPSTQEFLDFHLPMMQWLMDKYFEQFQILKKERDECIKTWKEIRESITISNKINVFENKKIQLTREEHLRVLNWLKHKLDLLINSSDIFTNILSKKIYNHLLDQVQKQKSDLSVEDQGNQAYTKWRDILIEIITYIPSLSKHVEKLPGKNPRAILDLLATHLTPILGPILGDEWEQRNPISSGYPKINLLSILHPDQHSNCAEAIQVFNHITKIISRHLYQLTEELLLHQQILTELKEIQSDATSKHLEIHKMDVVKKSIQELIELLPND